MSDGTKPVDTRNGAGPDQAMQPRSNESATVAHAIPGRTRLRLKRELRTPAQMAKIKDQLEQQEGVRSVSVNHRTGSVLIKHERHVEGHKVLQAVLQDVELGAESVLEVPEADSPYERMAERIADQTWSIENAIYQRTGERIHFGYIIPAAIAGLGAYQILVFGIGLELLPGPILLWMAYEIMRRLNAEPRFPPRRTGEVGAAVDVPVTAAPVAI